MITDLRRRFPVDTVELAWDAWGEQASATTLLLCHGFSGSAHDFALHAESLAEHRPVVALDHRGHGRSTKLGTTEGYSISRLAADLIALIEHAASAPIDLLGHSMGGAISLRVTLDRPDLVRSLVLMDTSAWSFAAPDPEIAAFIADFLGSYDPNDGLPDLTALGGPEDALIAAATPPEWQALRDQLAAAFDPWALKALGDDLIVHGGPDVRGELGSIRCPVTVIVGEHDHPFVDQAEALAAEVSDGRLCVIGGAYHSPQLTHPEAWSAAVESHLARLT